VDKISGHPELIKRVMEGIRKPFKDDNLYIFGEACCLTVSMRCYSAADICTLRIGLVPAVLPTICLPAGKRTILRELPGSKP